MEDLSFLLKHAGGTISVLPLLLHAGRSRAGLQASLDREDTNLPLSPKDCWILAASSWNYVPLSSNNAIFIGPERGQMKEHDSLAYDEGTNLEGRNPD